jgi:hypothetical protein
MDSGKGLFSNFAGIAVNAYQTGDGVPPVSRVEEAQAFFNKPIFVVETGMMDRNFSSFVNNYQDMLNSSATNGMGVLIFNGFYQNGDSNFSYHKVFDDNPQYLQTVIGDCGDGTYSYGSVPSPSELEGGEDTVTSCAFEQAIMEPCETEGDLALNGNIRLFCTLETETCLGEWFVTSHIKSLPAFKYFAETDYQGSENADWVSQAGAYRRLSFYDQYDFSKSIAGYGMFLNDSGNISGRPQYVHGSGVLIASLGSWKNYVTPVVEPHPGFKVDAKIIPPEDITTTHGSRSGVANFFQNLFESLKPNKCKRTDYEIDKLYKENVTSGYESLVDHGVITYNLRDVIWGSNLIETLDGKECEKEYGHCKVLGNLSNCNPHHWETESHEIGPDHEQWDPALPAPQYITERKKVWENLNEDGSIKEGRREALMQCITDVSNGLGGIEVEVKTGSQGTFALGGANYLLKTYDFEIQSLTTRPICHNKNNGIQADVENVLYFRNLNCSGGQAVGTGSCGANNVCANPGFEYAVSQVGKDNWIFSSGWYPWIGPGNEKDPEYNVFVAGDRGNPSIVQKGFVAGKKMDIGFMHPVELDQSMPAGTKIKVTGFYQPFAGNMGCSYGDMNDTIHVSVGIAAGNQSDNRGASFNEVGAPGISDKGSCSTPPPWTKFEAIFDAPDLTSFTVLIRAVSDYGPMNNNIFIDDICIEILDEGNVYTNTLGVDTNPNTNPPGVSGGGDGDGFGSRGFCEPDVPFAKPGCTEFVTRAEQRAYFPFLGSLVENIPAYQDLVQATFDDSIPDLLDCTDPEAKDQALCYCELDSDGNVVQMDLLTQYLAEPSVGMLNEAELDALGFRETAISEGIISQEPEDTPSGPVDWTSDYVPTINEELVQVLDVIEKKMRDQGRCVPKEMIASIMSLETHTNYTKDDMPKYPVQYMNNNSLCEKANKGCTDTTTPNDISINDRDRDDQIYSARKFLWQNSNCISSISQVTDQDCINARRLGDHFIVCCDVRGPMQFEIGTWVGYKDRVGAVSRPALGELGFDTSEYDWAKRERTIDAIVAAAYMLSTDTSRCSLWDDDPESIVREKARAYNRSNAYNDSAWDRYKSFYTKFNE